MRRDLTLVEIRQHVRRDVVDVIDAVGLASGKTRADLIGQVLFEFASQRAHEANVIHRVTRGNPPLMEVSGLGAE